MGDSQRPETSAASFEIPDLDVPPMRPAQSATHLPAAKPSFDAFALGPLEPLELLEPARRPEPPAVQFGSEIQFDDDTPLHIELAAEALTVAAPAPPVFEPSTSHLDPIRQLAGYGEAPDAIQLTPAYAWRVFSRQRALKRDLAWVSAACAKVEMERGTRASATSERADELRARRDLLFAAITSYDVVRVRQGVRLSLTLMLLLIVLMTLKLTL